ncbi:GHKL domain-containing protein [Eubacterium sp.]
MTYKIILPMIYLMCEFTTEVIGYFILIELKNLIAYKSAVFMCMLLCEFMRYFVVYFLDKIINKKMPKLSSKIICLLIAVPAIGILISCLDIYILKSYDNKLGKILCISIILMTMLNDIVMFELFNGVIRILSEKNEQNLLLQEANAKEIYYRQIEENNREVREIKHNLKNRLLAINKQEKINEVNKIINELEESDRKVVTSNIVLNTILMKKISEAENRNINVKTKVFVPDNLNIGYDDLGIIIGNLLDNAREASEKIDIKDRKIDIHIRLINSVLFIKVKNNKKNENVNIAQTNKKDKLNHGMGVSSIKKVVNKYNGLIEFLDEGEKFEVNISLYAKK